MNATARELPGRRRRTPRWPAYAANVLLLSLSYGLLALLGLQWATMPGAASPVFPAAGLALAWLAIGGVRLWPGVMLGRMLAFWMDPYADAWWEVGAISLGNAATAAAGAWMLHHARIHLALTHQRDVLWLTVGGALIASMIGATVGASTLAAERGLAVSQTWGVAVTWWSGNVTGVLIIAPLLLTWIAGGRLPGKSRYWKHLAICLLVTALAGWLVFISEASVFFRTWVVFPVLIWAALGLGVRGASAAMLVVAVTAVWGTTADRGPLVASRDSTQIILLQQFLGVASAVALLLAVVADERRGKKALAKRQAQLALAKTKLERANRAKDDFLAALSHELRNPLNPVLLAASSLLRRDDLSEDVRRDVVTIRRNVELEARLIDDLLDLTRIARGKLELRQERVDLAAVLQAAVQTSSEEDSDSRDPSGEDRLSIATHLEDQPVIVGDAARLQQVVWNLIKNARKFSPGGRVDISLKIADGAAVIEVTDTGIGIESHRLEAIFEAFEQGGRAVTRQFGGLGLGLAISRAIVEAHGGTIRASSAGLRHGATFTVVLPLSVDATSAARAASLPGQQDEARAKPSRIDLTGLRVLVIEDHASTRELMALLLTRNGCLVQSVGSVAEARREIDRQAFDLVISDLGLPDGSGHDVARALRARHGAGPPAIALSGFGRTRDIQAARASGFSRHLTKPISLDALLAEVQALVAGQSGESRPPVR